MKKILDLGDISISKADSYYIDDCGNIYDAHDNKVEVFSDSRGYLSVKLKIYELINNEGDEVKHSRVKLKQFKIHRLMAINFIPKTKLDNEYNRYKVFIKNRNKKDLRPSNLMWCNQYEINAIMYYSSNNNDLKKCIHYMVDKGFELGEMEHVIFDSGIIKQKFFRRRKLLKLIKECDNDILAKKLNNE